MGRFAIAVVWALIGPACATVQVGNVERVSAERARQSWRRVLEKYVTDEGKVDFAGLAQDPRDLELFVEYVGRVDAREESADFPTHEAQLAHEINAYNALCMYGVLRAGIPKTNAGLRKIRFFAFQRFRIAGRSESLHSFETRIRQRGDERVHFALNCMSVSCPRLPRVPFSAGALDAELDRQASSFFDDPTYLQVDPERRTARVSAILKFYTGDFLAHAPNLIEYINRYHKEPIPLDYRVEFLPYDWTFNNAASASPRASR
jgi:hypothetical protein